MENYFGKVLFGYKIGYKEPGGNSNYTHKITDFSSRANNNNLVSLNQWIIPTPIDVSGKIIRIESDSSYSCLFAYDNYRFDWTTDIQNYPNDETFNFASGWMKKYTYIGVQCKNDFAGTLTYIKITDVTDENNPILLFEWRR